MNVQETSFQYERLDSKTHFKTETNATRSGRSLESLSTDVFGPRTSTGIQFGISDICPKRKGACHGGVSKKNNYITGAAECHCLLQKELRDEHERRTEDELSKQREYINLKSPSADSPSFLLF